MLSGTQMSGRKKKKTLQQMNHLTKNYYRKYKDETCHDTKR